MTTITEATAPGTGRPDGCPPWCDIPDHDQYDSSKGGHASDGAIVRLHHYPHFDGTEFQSMQAALTLDAGEAEPYVELVARDEKTAAKLTMPEAEELGLALLREAGKLRMSQAAQS